MSDKIKVLAVDDAPANLMILKGCLRGGNFELVTCTNAIDALQEFKNQITWDSNTYYLNKVFDKKVLVQKITEVVNMHRTRQLDRSTATIWNRN